MWFSKLSETLTAGGKMGNYDNFPFIYNHKCYNVFRAGNSSSDKEIAKDIPDVGK